MSDKIPTNPLKVLPAISRASYAAQLETGYASEINGRPFILAYDPDTGSTVLQPVTLADAQIGGA